MKHFYLTCIAAIVLLSPVVSASPLPLGTSVPELAEGGTLRTPSTPSPLGDTDSVSALIDAIGEVTFTADCKARIDAAQEAWDQLSFTEKLRLATAGAKLTAAQATYKALETAAKVKVTALEAKIALLLTKIEYSEEFKAQLDEAQAEYDALTPEEKALMSDETKAMLPILQTAYRGLEAEARIKAAAVKTKINLIGDVALTDRCKSRIDEANDAYEALTPGQRTLVDNADVLFAAIAEYNRLAEDARYQARFALEFDSIYQLRFAEDYARRFALEFDSIYPIRFAEDYASQFAADFEVAFASRFDSIYPIRFAEDFPAAYQAQFAEEYPTRFEADYAVRCEAEHTTFSCEIAGAAAVETTVRKGFTDIDLTPASPEWTLASVLVDGNECTALVADDILRLDIQQPTALSVTYRWADMAHLYSEEDLPAGAEITTAEGIKAYVRDGQLCVEADRQPISIYTISGALITSRQPAADIAIFSLPAGTYIIQVGREALKLTL